MKVFALPGFLGTPKDFTPFLKELRKKSGFELENDILAVCTDKERAPARGDWTDWSHPRLEELRRWKKEDRLFGIGYSLGGRLLLSIAALDPLLFDGLVFISTNPGLNDPAERLARMQNDEKWAKRFAKDPWKDVMKDWNAQPVFQEGVAEPERREKDYDRKQLGRVMKYFSLALQPDFKDEVSSWRIPQLWMAGEKDLKFRRIVESMRPRVSPSALACEIIPGASHRLVQEAPDAVIDRIVEWMPK